MKIAAFFALVLGLLASGCATYEARVEPGKNLAQIRRYWVRSNLDDNHAIDQLIVAELKRRGHEAEYGPLTMMPREAQALITFRDHWTWDFKDHMAGLELKVEDTRAEKQIAAASFVGPASLTATPAAVVEKLIQQLFEPKKKKKE